MKIGVFPENKGGKEVGDWLRGEGKHDFFFTQWGKKSLRRHFYKHLNKCEESLA